MSFNNHVMQLEKTSGHAVLWRPGLMDMLQGRDSAGSLGAEGGGAAAVG